MRRREFIAGLGGAARRGRLWRVREADYDAGDRLSQYLSEREPTEAAAFRRGLAERAMWRAKTSQSKSALPTSVQS